MIKRFKRPLSGLLSLCLVATMIPSTVFKAGAADNLIYVAHDGNDLNIGSMDEPLASVNAAYAAAQDGDSIILLDAVESDVPITMDDNKAITLKGDAGASLTYTGSTPLHSGSEAFLMLQRGSLTIENLRIGLPDVYGTNGRVLMIENADAVLGAGAVLANGYLAYGGGGVRIGSGANLLLQAGSVIQNCYIANNTSEYGGGVQVLNGGALVMQGGEISNNTIHTMQGYESYGGGVAVMAGGRMVASGGSINGNAVDTAAGGIYIAPDADVEISGDFSVVGNTANGQDSNLYLPSKNSFTVSGPMTGTVGITCGDPDYKDIVGTPNGYEIAADDEAAFEYDGGSYDIRLKEENLVLWWHTVGVDFNGTGVESSNTETETPIGEDYDTVLKPADGVELPDEIDVVIGGEPLAPESDYTYDPETGALHIPGDQITGDIDITATGNGLYTITVTAANVQTDVESAVVTQQATTTITLAKAQKYALPETVQVSGACDYTYLDGVITVENVTENITVTAEGVDIHHTITFDPNEGTCELTQKDIVESREKIGELPLPVRDGYTFVGWFDAFDNRVTANTANNLSADLALTAKWSEDTNISYKVQHWTEFVDSGINPRYESGVTSTITIDDKKYYLYQTDAYNDGVSDTALDLHSYLLTAFGEMDIKGIIPNADNQYTVAVLPNGSSVFHLRYHRAIYKVSFDPNGGNNLKPGDTIAAVKYGSYYAVMPQAIRSGYTLIGWFTDDGEQRKAGDVCRTVGDHVLYAHWQSDGDTKYQVRHVLQPLHDNLPETDRSKYVLYQTSDLKGTSDAEVDIYALAVKGFKPREDNPETIHVNPDGAAIETIYYDRLPVTIHYDANGGTDVSINNVIYYGGTIFLLADWPTRTGYYCNGWYNGISAVDHEVKLGDNINALNPSVKPDITLYAHWTARTYGVTLVVSGGTASGPLNVTYDTAVGAMPIAEKTGYTFIEWTLADGTPITSDTLVNTDTLIDTSNGTEQAKTLYAQYTANHYTLTFDPAGGNPLDVNTLTVTFNEKFGTLPVAEKPGYVFEKWTFADGSALRPDDICKITEDTMVYANYFAKHLNISFDSNGGSAASPPRLVAEYGKPFGLLATTTRGGYTFVGWYTDKDAGAEITADTVVSFTQDTALYAHWTPSGGGGGGGGSGGGGGATYTITATAEAGASITPDGKVSVSKGADKHFAIFASAGYVIHDVVVDGKSVGAVSSYNFKDVRANHTIEVKSASMLTGAHIKYIAGYPDGAVRPDAPITRAEAAMIFYTLLSDEAKSANSEITVSFTDADEAWSATAINTLADMGIIEGYPDGSFRPNNGITRAEFSALASRFEDLDEGRARFSDVPTTHWAYELISSAASKGWLAGYTNGTFHPDDTITRAETVKIVNAVSNRNADRDYIAAHPTGIIKFTDLNAAHWAYYEFMEAAIGHECGQSSADLEVWTKLK